MLSDRQQGILWAFAAASCTAGFVIPWKVASTHGGIATNTLVLLVAAAVFNSLLTVIRQRAVPKFSRFDLGVAIALAFFTLLGNHASSTAISMVSPALLTVMQRGEVIVVALLAWPILGERIDWKFWLGAITAAAGLLLLADTSSADTTRADGIAWACLSTLSFSSLAVLTRKFIFRIDVVSVNALRLWLSIGLWFAWNGLPDELYEISGPQVLYASIAAFFGPFLGRLFLMQSALKVEARITSLTNLASPPMTLAFAYLLLSDLPSTREIQGGIIMLIGIAIPIFGMARSRRTTAASN